MRIGKNLIRYRFAKGWSQEDLAREVGMSQSNYSKIESDKQDASPEQIEAFASALGIAPSGLLGPDSPIFTSENQHGGHANNYFVQNGAEALIAAKDETIAVLKASSGAEHDCAALSATSIIHMKAGKNLALIVFEFEFSIL